MEEECRGYTEFKQRLLPSLKCSPINLNSVTVRDKRWQGSEWMLIYKVGRFESGSAFFSPIFLTSSPIWLKLWYTCGGQMCWAQSKPLVCSATLQEIKLCGNTIKLWEQKQKKNIGHRNAFLTREIAQFTTVSLVFLRQLFDMCAFAQVFASLRVKDLPWHSLLTLYIALSSFTS